MDRVIVYDGALPQSSDVLNTNKFSMIGLAFACQAAFGTGAVVNGLAASQQTPSPNMQINIAPGSIYVVDEVDATAYGDLGVDTNFVVKQGILYSQATLLLTAPTIVGFSQVYLVQAQLQDLDTGSTVLPYFNSDNPAQPFDGPSNSGAAQLTLRQCLCTLSLVAGVPAATGSETTPAPSAGCVGLYTIDLTNGQTTIVNSQITQLATAPFFPNLPQIPGDVQTSAWTYALDTGTVNHVVASVSPPPAALVPGLVANIKLLFTVTGPADLNLNGLGAHPIHRSTGAALVSGDITAGQVVSFIYDGSAFQIMNFSGATSASTTNNYNSFAIPFGTDNGSVNAMNVPGFTPSVTSLVAGLVILVQATTTNTGACTLNAAGLGAINILENQVSLLPGAIVNGQMVLLCYDGTFWQKINSRNQYYSFDMASPPATAIPLQIGDQLNITFENVTAVAYHVATVPGIYEVEIAVTVNGSLFISCGHRPNDSRFGIDFDPNPDFDDFLHCNTDLGVTAPPYLTDNPVAVTRIGFGNEFGVHCFHGPRTFQDTVNAIGPFLIRMTFCTFPASKMCRWHGGFFGGPFHGHSFWNDIVLPWTSLGTFVVYKDFHHFGDALATISGLAYVKRLA